jgi:HD-GYP domain-containing protein (c-di-GMP phosphodiesterase class II)
VSNPHRLADVLGALSLATDGANGVRPETALRAATVAVAIGREAGLTPPSLRDAYRTALLRFLGCTSFSHETAHRYGGGDDLSFLRAILGADHADPVDVGRRIELALAGVDQAARDEARRNLASDRDVALDVAQAHCDLASALALRLEVGVEVASALREVFERWDGQGRPHGLAGDAISEPARLVTVAVCVVTARGFDAPSSDADTIAVVRARRGGALDPRFVDAFLRCAPTVLPLLAADSVWERFLEAEPAPHGLLTDDDLPRVADVFGDYVDMKSPFTLGHSRGVAELVRGAARSLGMAEKDVATARLAALLHDLGRVAVPNGIWDKPGPLGAIERERVNAHAWHTGRILARSPLFAGVAAIASAAHERADGSGYPRGVPSSISPLSAQLLAAADVFHALREERAHRRAHAIEQATKILRDEATAMRLDRRVVEAVLAAGGVARHETRDPRANPHGLTDREIEVLCWLARGLSNKEIAVRTLVLS